MSERDRVVFEFARANQIPIVWNLASGYQDPIDSVLILHVNTCEECLTTWFRE